jgi:hypothetical protein
MKIPVTVIGFGLYVAGSTPFGQLRGSYLRQKSEKVSIDSSKEMVLCYAIWVYLLPILGLALSVFCAYDVSHNKNNQPRMMIGGTSFLFLFLGSIFMFYRFRTGRIMIFNGKLTYTEGGDRSEIYADDVLRFSFNGLSLLVKKKSGRVTRIPATFEHSEIILAYLKQATMNK